MSDPVIKLTRWCNAQEKTLGFLVSARGNSPLDAETRGRIKAYRSILADYHEAVKASDTPGESREPNRDYGNVARGIYKAILRLTDQTGASA